MTEINIAIPISLVSKSIVTKTDKPTKTSETSPKWRKNLQTSSIISLNTLTRKFQNGAFASVIKIIIKLKRSE